MALTEEEQKKIKEDFKTEDNIVKVYEIVKNADVDDLKELCTSKSVEDDENHVFKGSSLSKRVRDRLRPNLPGGMRRAHGGSSLEP